MRADTKPQSISASHSSGSSGGG